MRTSIPGTAETPVEVRVEDVFLRFSGRNVLQEPKHKNGRYYRDHILSFWRGSSKQQIYGSFGRVVPNFALVRLVIQ